MIPLHRAHKSRKDPNPARPFVPRHYRHVKGCDHISMLLADGGPEEREMAHGVAHGKAPQHRVRLWRRPESTAWCSRCRRWRPVGEFRWSEMYMVVLPKDQWADPSRPLLRQEWTDRGPIV